MEHARPALVKSLDWGVDWPVQVARYDTRVLILRKWADDDSSLVPSPQAAAERLWRRFAPDFDRVQASLAQSPVQLYLETPWNEAHQETPDQLARHAEACVRFTQLAHAAGWRILVGNFSVCWPKPEHFVAFAPAVAEAEGVSLHEYWMPDRLYPGDWTAHAGPLYDALPADCPRPPVWITECGIDNVDRSRPVNQYGWRSYARPDAAYVAELDQFAASQPPVVAGLALFNSGAIGPRWRTFEVAESAPVAAWLAAGPRDWSPLPPPDPDPQEPPPMPDETWDPNPDRLAPVVDGGAILAYATERRLVYCTPENFGPGGHSWAVLLDPATDLAYRVEWTPRTGVRPFEQDRDA